ncbi:MULTISPECIES: hypothetical protein [Bacillus]|nr:MULTISPECIES: hypothetical protein [Bacillus]MDF9666519.1 hypothetical protein [Bacillus wiedmannii]MDI6508214.1 hypothetical protein [Bacillus wiedmannii]MDI6513987.1 hypothetical protein [Bacillus wiedmannii]PFZ19568.1 hypothetical protein COL51_27700 [Bacillus wiedmannii]PGC50143.1 hypothetical protein COM22_28960 [Bacillus wiedmannii]
MSVSVSNELQLFAQKIQSVLSPNALRDLARDFVWYNEPINIDSKPICILDSNAFHSYRFPSNKNGI